MGPAVGIDLGTTSSLIAWVNPKTGLPECFPGPQGSASCPSVVSAEPDGRVVVGEAARQLLTTHPERTTCSAKRLLGRTGAEIAKWPAFGLRAEGGAGPARLHVGERRWTAPEISAFILRELKAWAEICVGRPLRRAAIAVPANFNQAQRIGTMDAARLAGFTDVCLPSEPAAAALALGALQKRRGLMAACDFGGGTFDVSIIRVTADAHGRPLCEVLATDGDSDLGGDDIDDILAEMVCREIRRGFGVEMAERRDALQELRRAVARAKHELSIAHETQVQYPLGSAGLYVRAISRIEFESLIEPLIERAGRCAEAALSAAGIAAREVDELTLLGNCTHIPMMRRAMARVFGREPRATAETGQSVAMGAAMWAASTDADARIAIRESSAFAVAALSSSGATEEIFARNTPLPATARRAFKPRRGRAGCEIEIRELSASTEKTGAHSLGRIRLKPAKAAAESTALPIAGPSAGGIQVEFVLDANGIVQAVAPSGRKGEWKSVELRPACCIPREELERMIQSATERDDRAADPELLEARLLAEIALQTTTNQLADPRAAALAKDERESIAELAARLRVVMLGSDRALIAQRVADLLGLSERLRGLFEQSLSRGQAAG